MPPVRRIARAKCPACDARAVELRPVLIEDDSLGQPFRGEAERVEIWKCRQCGFEPDASFRPDDATP
jgi:Zn ribbon nucleic-acid-binding protein